MNNTNVQLQSVYQSDVVWNGVTVSDDGRVFVNFPRIEGDSGMRIGEVLKDHTIKPYPDESWNNWKPEVATENKLVRTNSLRMGADGNLWIIDTGTPAMGKPALAGGAKLVVVDINTNKVIRIIHLDSVSKPNTFIDDIRIHDNTIFITDAGEPAIIIMDKTTGKGRRVLEHEVSTTDAIPMLPEGKVMKTSDGKNVLIHADQLELSPDGTYFYFQPSSGPLYRVETKYLLDENISKSELASHVKKWFATPTTGGTAIDAAGNIYVSDVHHLAVIKISPNGKSEMVIKDDRLLWCDAMWIDKEGYLWMPVGQLNRLSVFQNGKEKIQYPLHIYKLHIGVTPFRS